MSTKWSSLSVEAMLLVSGPEVGGVAVFPDAHNSGSWPVFERNNVSGAIPDARFRDNIHDPTQRTGS